MKAKDICVISYTKTDVETGEILESGIREYDLRFHVQRLELHKLLDRFIDQHLKSPERRYLSFELQTIFPPLEGNIPF